MLWLIKFLIFGHVHKWKEVSTSPLTITSGFGRVIGKGERVHVVCEKCGAHSTQDLE